MQPFSLDHLTDTEFEQFCFDLLGELGFTNVNWRKGTGLNASPSDRGRDIVCEKIIEEVDGTTHLEKWFVECKHYKQGVPPDKIQGALAWAAAERPDKLLIIASNFLSNPTKDYLDSYTRNNNPNYKIKYWERPSLEKLTIDKTILLRKYKISGEFLFLDILHPAHALYLRSSSLNTLAYLFEQLDKLDPGKRDKIMYVAYMMIIKPRFRESTSGEESLNDLRIDEVSYDIFKERCLDIVEAGDIDHIMLTFLIVNYTLKILFTLADYTRLDEVIANNRSMIDALQEENDLTDEQRRDFIAFLEDRTQRIPVEAEENYDLYAYFCVNVITPLLVEELKFTL